MKRLRWVVGILAILAGLYAWVYWPLEPVPLVISKQTTYLLGPLKADGTVDYRSAIDQRLAEGVTRENNAAIPLLEALGPGILEEKSRDEILGALGLKGLPKEGKYFTRIEDHAAARGLKVRYDKPLDYPGIDEWLAENEAPLAKVLEASKRTRFYLPLVSSPGSASLDDAWSLKVANTFLLISSTLHARARRRLQNGDLRGAWEDGLALLRLGCLAAQYGTILFNSMGQSMRGRACDIAFDIAKAGKLSKADGLRMISDFSNLPAIPGAPEFLGIERLWALDTFLKIARDGGAAVDGNVMLSEANRWFDLWEGAFAKNGYAAQEAELVATRARLEAESAKMAAQLKNKLKLCLLYLEGSSRRRVVSNTVIVQSFIAMMREKITRPLHGSRADVAARSGLTVISLGLAAWKSEHGSFPERLDALSPDYLNPPPLDPFTDRPFIYRRNDKGYILYSPWWNLKDDNAGERDMVLKVE